MKIQVIIAFLPILCDGKIQINVTVASNKHYAEVKYSGQDDELVTESENKLFNISMANLNHGFRVELGRVPDGIFLKDPTPYGNLFHKYKWPEVTRHLQVEKIEVIEIINKEMELKTNELTNNSTENTKVPISLFENVENNVFSTWSDKGLPVEDIFYNMTIKFDGSSFRYENKWRDSSLKSKIVRFGKSFNGHVNIQPNQSIAMKLSGTKTIFVLQVDYKATLIGNLIGNYDNLYGKYHFWAPTVQNIMRAAAIPNEVRTSERIEIRCYTDPKFEVHEKGTGLAVTVRPKRRLLFKFRQC